MELQFDWTEAVKNTPKSRVENTPVGEGIHLISLTHPGDEALRLRREIDQSLIQFYFALEGGAVFHFNQGNYRLELEPGTGMLFYNPQKVLPLDIEVASRARLVFLYITVDSLHRLFVAESEEIAFLSAENVDKKYYTQLPVSPQLSVVLNQLFHSDVQGASRTLMLRAKTYEMLALLFNREEGTDAEQCPFLSDEQNVERIRLAKKIIVERMSQPPTLPELAREIGLNEYRLKEGFKNIYGKTVFQFLNHYRMDSARHLLDQGGHKVNEVAYQIGYANPSHFIAAFRKKFGVTPKKYLTGKALS